MNEYTNEDCKKEEERESLEYFLDAYEDITGESINIHEAHERPDFICIRSNGKQIGIELTKVRRGHPNDILFDKIVEKQEYMSIGHALNMIKNTVNIKETKRRKRDWSLPEATILLIELMDIPLAEINGYIHSENLPDLFTTGFAEVWLADYTGLDAYDNVELFCVQPYQWAGYHPRVYQKPYG